MHSPDSAARPPTLPAHRVSPKEEAFCLAIVAGSNASDAYRTAYRPQRAKAKTIHEKASRLMTRGKVQARIAELMAPVIAGAQMSRAEWLERITRCCRFDPRKMFDSMGNLKGINQLDDSEAIALLAFESPENFGGCGARPRKVRGTTRFRFIDRVAALALLGKACHWYADRREGTREPDGGSMQKNIVVEFVKPSVSHEEAYHRMVTGP